jgi:hypothetical protein
MGAASAANASGLLETALSKVRRPQTSVRTWGVLTGALPIRSIVYREEVEAEPSVAQLPDRVMRRRNAVAYMRSYVILNFSVLATAPPVSAIDLPSAATV